MGNEEINPQAQAVPPVPEEGEAGKKEGQPDIQVSEIDQLKIQVEEYKDKNLRLYAEFENVRKRLEREKLEFIKYANEQIIVEFLGILDDLERSVIVAKEKHQNYENFLKGVEMIMRRILELLKKHGVEAIRVEPGKPFDPNCHEILMQEPRDDFEDGAVVEEFQKGYRLGDRIVRTAKVKVAQKAQQ